MAVVLAMALFTSTMILVASSQTVIIIGAGMSGIMAAKTLAENGVTDLLILEATEKIGGRMRSQGFGGINVELGANWVEGVHGKQMNPIWKLANRYKLRTFKSEGEITDNIFTDKGRLSSREGEEAYRKSAAAWDFATELGASRIKNNEPDISILTAERLFGHVPSTPVEMALEYYNYDIEFAEPPRVTSLKNTQPNPTFSDFGDDSYIVVDPRGYAFLVRELAKTFLMSNGGAVNDSRLQLNKVVNRIYDTDGGVRVSTEDGLEYVAEYAILTVSLGVLQSKVIEFHPDLPAWKLEALYQFDMAIYTKIFLKFPYSFWPTNGNRSSVFIYADERRGYYPQWQHLDKEYPGSSIIFAKVTDDESRRIEQQSDKDTKAEMMAVLRKMFGDSIPEPDEVLIPRWWKNRFFQGTYSNWPIGVDECEFQRIKAPVNRLYFSGEHTSRKYNGYVHGAYLSGIETAELLLKCHQTGKCKTDVPKPCNCSLVHAV